MAIYHYKDSQLIERIDVRTLRHGIARAAITLNKNATPEQLEKLRQDLGSQGLSTLMDSTDGKSVIQVRALKDGKTLINALDKLGFAASSGRKEATPDDNQKPNFRERIRGKSLFLSAIFYDLGNIAFFVSGIQRGRHNPGGKFTSNDISEMLIGGAFSVGDVLMTAYGNDKGDEELAAAAQGLKRHLNQKGLEVPKGDMLNPDTLHQSGVMKATDRWIRKHIIHIKCLSEFAGGLFSIHAAMKPENRNNGKLAAGFMISTGWLATFLLDKPHSHRIFDGDKEPVTLAEKATHDPRGWIARPLAMGNNIANLYGSLNETTGERTKFRDAVHKADREMRWNNTPETRANLARAQASQHDYVWNVISAGAFLVAHSLFGLSGSKRPRERTSDFEVEHSIIGETDGLRPNETVDDRVMMNDLVLMSANLLSKQPEKVRDLAIAETAEYVSKLSHVRLTESEVEDAIRKKVDSLTHSTWADRLQSAPPSQLHV